MSVLSRLKGLTKPGRTADPPGRGAVLDDIVQRCRSAIAICGGELGRLAGRVDELAATQAEWQRRAEQALAAGDEPEARRLLADRIQLTERLNRLHRARQVATRANQELFDRMTALSDRLAVIRSVPQTQCEPANSAEREQVARAEQAIDRVWVTQAEAAKLGDGLDPPLGQSQLAELVNTALAAARKMSGRVPP
jgi:hypothetical protein